ncbi:MAG: HEAT repeat protein [Cognaticolwellia sp.]|jgi:HEAT repeat protein
MSRGTGAILAARRLVELGEGPSLVRLLSSPIPGLRSAAADGCSDKSSLLRALEVERCASVAGVLAARAVKSGADLSTVQSLLERRVLVSLRTPAGLRTPEATLGLGIGEPVQDLELALRPREQALTVLVGASPGPELWQSMEALSVHRQSEDYPRLKGLTASAGKRGQNSLLLALGRLGDPRALPLLQDNLARMDVDPGRGFAWRRLSALALGRIGDPGAAPTLRRALEIEALEYEGRPGAGLGIQFPVRAVLLWALGELQDPGSAELLAGYLDHTSGSALGGFHLPAMGALYKLGAVAKPVLEQVASLGSEQARGNASAVLQAL